MRLCVDRMIPPRRERPISLDLPDIKTADDIQAAFRMVMQAQAQDDVTNDQGGHLIKGLEFGLKLIELQGLKGRVEKVEDQMKEIVESDERRAA